MTRIGIPVPPGFTIPTEVCIYFYAHQRRYPNGLDRAVTDALKKTEKIIGRGFGDPANPLLVSVRSGARESMPGMMDTVLNLGLNDRTVEGLAARSKNPRFAYDSYRRFVQMYADVVLGHESTDKVDADPLTQILDSNKRRRGVAADSDLTVEDLRDLVRDYKSEIRALGKDFPEDPYEQLWGAIGAVFGSWNNDRAIAYRDLYHIPHHWGTAVNVQAMVFGNLGDRCATGVAFTRDPATGDKRFYGEFLVNAQGEDVVAGIRTPKSIAELQHVMPMASTKLRRICRLLEKHYREMQDIEFTIEDDKFWMLQTRTGKRTGFASVRIAVDMVSGADHQQARSVTAGRAGSTQSIAATDLRPQGKESAQQEGLSSGRGLPAGPGAATGRIVFHAEDAVEWNNRGERVILCRIETSPDDIRGMDAAQGVLTARGGMTSHAALVARQMGKVCVAGCEALQIDYAARALRVEQTELTRGRLDFDRWQHWRGIQRRDSDPSFGNSPGANESFAGCAAIKHLSILCQIHEVGGSNSQAWCPNQCGPTRSSRH